MEFIVNSNQITDIKNHLADTMFSSFRLFRSKKYNPNVSLDNYKVGNVYARLNELSKNSNGELRKEKHIGIGEDGQKIALYSLFNKYNRNDKPVILIVGGVHGNEKTSIYGIIETVNTLLNYNSVIIRFLKDNFTINIIPCLNIHGFNNNSRYNLNNKDLNRDFYDCSQAETRVLTEYISNNKENIKIILDSHNAYNEEYISCKKNAKYFNLYEHVTFSLNLFLRGTFESNKLRSHLFVSRSVNNGTLSDYINENGFIGHTVESPRSLSRIVDYRIGGNYLDGCEVTKNLLINLSYIYGNIVIGNETIHDK